MGATFHAGRGVEHWHRVARPIDEQLLAGGMRLPHRRRHGLAPIPIEVAEATIAVAVDMIGAVLLPQQLQRHTPPLQLLVNVVPIRLGSCRCGLERRRREQAPLQLRIIHLLWHRPGDADHTGTPQILGNRRPAHAHRHGNLPLAQAERVLQSQGFADLPHRRSLGGHRTSLASAQRRPRAAIRSPTTRASGPPQGGGRIRSE